MPETKDLLLKHPDFSDWKQMYANIWSRPESARYMLWDVTTSESAAKARMERTIAFQKGKSVWVVYEKSSGQAIGFAGTQEISPGVWEETGIAVGPDYCGKGYGKQLLNCLIAYARQNGNAREFHACCRSENAPSRGMILHCGFQFSHSENRIDPRTNLPFIMEFYIKQL